MRYPVKACHPLPLPDALHFAEAGGIEPLSHIGDGVRVPSLGPRQYDAFWSFPPAASL